MPCIRPSSDLRDRYDEVSAFCHRHNKPVYLTENGVVDLVVMSVEAYETLAERMELYGFIGKGVEDIEAGRTIPAAEAIEEVEKALNDGTL